MRVYIASGWFTPNQESTRIDIINLLSLYEIDFYSPKDDGLALEDDSIEDLKEIFKENLREIEDSDYIIASTIDKDMGTLFECGYAYSKGIPIIYYAPGLKGPFNLMLAQSSHNVAISIGELEDIIRDRFPKGLFDGRIE